MTRAELDACWRDPHNYRWGLIYYCKADPRAVVPRRLKWMGWTVNFARASAIPTLLLLISMLVIPYFVVEALGGGLSARLITLATSILAVCLTCAYLSSRTE